MSQFCCYKLWDSSLKKFRRAVLILALVDLLVVLCVITYVGISLYHVSVSPPVDAAKLSRRDSNDNNNHNNEESPQTATLLPLPIECQNNDVNDDDITREDDTKCQNVMSRVHNNNNNNGTGRMFDSRHPSTPYFAVVGARIAKSIQLIIYTCQLFMNVALILGLLKNDTHPMRNWLIVTEIITTIIFLILVLYLFGSWHADTLLITGSYVVFQFTVIRTVSRFIRRTEIELTQFGSIVTF